MVEQSGGRTLTVAATKRWATRTTLEFADFCKGLGVDLLMTLPMDHVFSDEGKINWYKAAADVLPIMIVGFPTWGVLDGVKDDPRICSFKEDGTLNYTIDMLVRYPEQWAYITGGMYKRHLVEWPYGVESYFCWASGFAPDVAKEYWSAIQANDTVACARIVRDIEAPLFKLMERYPEMFQDVIRGALELNGVAQRYLPSPRRSLTDAEMEELGAVLKPLGLLH
jgi:dihydrodipicolinate synthase/N-acetylneuraminate lyase